MFTDKHIEIMSLAISCERTDVAKKAFDMIPCIDNEVGVKRYYELKKAFMLVAAVEAFGISKELDNYLHKYKATV